MTVVGWVYLHTRVSIHLRIDHAHVMYSRVYIGFIGVTRQGCMPASVCPLHACTALRFYTPYAQIFFPRPRGTAWRRLTWYGKSMRRCLSRTYLARSRGNVALSISSHVSALAKNTYRWWDANLTRHAYEYGARERSSVLCCALGLGLCVPCQSLSGIWTICLDRTGSS
jgi:hypothetical protein